MATLPNDDAIKDLLQRVWRGLAPDKPNERTVPRLKIVIDHLIASRPFHLSKDEAAALKRYATEARARGDHDLAERVDSLAAAATIAVESDALHRPRTREPSSASWTRNGLLTVTTFVFDPSHRVEFHGTAWPLVWAVAPEIPDGRLFLGQHPLTKAATPEYGRQVMQLATATDLGVPALTFNHEWFSGSSGAQATWAQRQLAEVRRRATHGRSL